MTLRQPGLIYPPIPDDHSPTTEQREVKLDHGRPVGRRILLRILLLRGDLNGRMGYGWIHGEGEAMFGKLADYPEAHLDEYQG